MKPPFRQSVCVLVAACLAHAAAESEEMAVIAREVAPASVVASSEFGPPQSANNLINGSGMDHETHDRESGARTMWHTVAKPPATAPARGLPVSPAWVRFDFKEPQSLDEIRLWNHNQAGCLDRGLRAIRIFESADGSRWSKLTSKETIALKQGGDADQTIAVTSRQPVKSIIIAAESNFGSDYYGLSEVKFIQTRKVPADEVPFPTAMECQPLPEYRHRADGKPGRQILVKFTGEKLHGKALLEIKIPGFPAETTELPADPSGMSETSILLPAGAAVDREAQVSMALTSGKRSVRTSLMVPPQRQWTIYLLPHSHVDIGYTNTQENVEFIHRRNILESIKLAKETASFPEEARFRWDTEVAWPAERLLANGTEEEKKAMLAAIRDGTIHVGASYINDNTSVSADEEFAAFFGPSKRIEKLTGRKCDTLMQVDVPGMSWGVVQAAAQQHIPYVLLFNNGSDRTGHSMELSHRPFWWIGPDGKSKVLCYQPGSYATCAQLKGITHAMAIMGQTDRSKIPATVRTNNPRAGFIDGIYGQPGQTGTAFHGYIWGTLQTLEKDPLYPYDIFTLSWALADNTPIDADLPYAVKSWNEEYAYPRLVIGNSHDIMAAMDKKFGDRIPTRTGEFTEYWSDGLGSAAKQTAMNRNAKERLIQTDTLGAMLHPGKPAPRAEFDEAWRNVLLGSEHTWCYSQPDKQPMQNEIMKVKFGYFQQADDLSHSLLNRALKTSSYPVENQVTVFNTLSWPRTGLVTLPTGSQTPRGVVIQKLSTGETVFLANEVPALGARTYPSDRSASSDKPDLKMTSTTLENSRIKVTLDPATGDITSLASGGVEYAKGPINSYHYLKGTGKSAPSGPTNVKISVKENGPVLASLLVESQAEGCRWLKREIRLLAGQPQLEIINTLDKTATTSKEGVHFGFAFDIPDSRNRMDIPWGVAEVDADFFPEANRNWICFQRWLDISNPQRGVTWCSPDAPTFEHGAITANILGGAVHSPAWLRKLDPSATIYSWALNNHWHTNFPLSQEGVLTFRYSILPHASAYDASAANRFGMEVARPLIATSGGFPAITPPLVLENPRVVVSGLKSLPEGMLVTLRSLSDKSETATLDFPANSKHGAAIPSDLLGETMGDAIPVTGDEIKISMLPMGLSSFLIRPSP